MHWSKLVWVSDKQILETVPQPTQNSYTVHSLKNSAVEGHILKDHDITSLQC